MNTHSSSVPLTDGQQAAQERMETPKGAANSGERRFPAG